MIKSLWSRESEQLVSNELVEVMKFALGSSGGFDWPVDCTMSMQRIAELLGHDLARSMKPWTLSGFARDLAALWREYGLGDMVWTVGDGAVVIRNCYDCSNTKVGLTSVGCTFKSTVIGTAMSDALGRSFRAEETACCKEGADSCVFVLMCA